MVGCTAYIQRRVTVSNDRKVEYSKYGSRQPVVVFMSGLGNTMDTRRDVYWSVSKVSTAVMVNRMGYGRSSKTDNPRTADQIVSELREFLAAAGYQLPCLLVGHSAGGLYAVYYTKTSPGVVGGMVLVDASH
ncbi:MAG TPA: alpha/beta hydrolase [bacterium]